MTLCVVGPDPAGALHVEPAHNPIRMLVKCLKGLMKTSDDKKLQSTLKKLSVNNIPGVEEVNMIKDDGNVIHFQNPKVQAAIAANTFSITGQGENKELSEMLPGILNQLGPDSLNSLKKLAESMGNGNPQPISGSGGDAEDDSDDDDVPDLVENFDTAAE